MKISAVVIMRDSEFFLRDLLDSLVTQVEPLHEILLVDSDSEDRTPLISKRYANKYPNIIFYNKAGPRGKCRNYGAHKATGDVVAFIDSDCIANPFWSREIRKSINRGADVVAGKTIRLGYEGFTSLQRVGMLHMDTDITYPSSNLSYKMKVFNDINGFDPWFKEAEEIDLNYRAVDKGYKLEYNSRAIAYHRARETFIAFFKQSFWYGFGRKELTLAHGSLWSEYNVLDMVKIEKEESIWKIIRLVIAAMGYVFCIFIKGNSDVKERFRASNVSSR